MTIEVHGLKTGKQMRAGLGEILTVVSRKPCVVVDPSRQQDDGAAKEIVRDCTEKGPAPRLVLCSVLQMEYCAPFQESYSRRDADKVGYIRGGQMGTETE